MKFYVQKKDDIVIAYGCSSELPDGVTEITEDEYKSGIAALAESDAKAQAEREAKERAERLARENEAAERQAKIDDYVNREEGKYSLSSEGQIVNNESLLKALFDKEDIYEGSKKLTEDQKANLARSILQKIIGSEEYLKLGGEEMSGPLATKVLEDIYTNKYGVGGTIYQNNKSQYGSNSYHRIYNQ